jgi:hypothetical protein
LRAKGGFLSNPRVRSISLQSRLLKFDGLRSLTLLQPLGVLLLALRKPVSLALSSDRYCDGDRS